MQYFEDCECEGVLFLTFKGGGGSILTSKWAGVAIFWAGCTRPPHHGLWGEGGCDSNGSLQLVRPLSHPAIPSQIVYSLADFPAVFFHISHWYLSWNKSKL